MNERRAADHCSPAARPARAGLAWPASMLGSPLTLRALLLLVAGLIVFHYRLGPVAFSLSATHGVHVGDALAALPGLAAVLPHRRLRLDRRLGLVTPVTPNPMRRASDRVPEATDPQ